MKQKIIIFIIYGLIFFGIGMGSSYFIFSKNISDNTGTGIISEENIEENIEIDSNLSSTGITINEALLKDGIFSENINFIKEKFNLAELLINEFKKVKNQKTFSSYIDKFGTQDIVFVLSKLKNKEDLYKYYGFLFDKYDVSKTDEEYFFGILDSYMLNGSYSGTYLYNGTPDSSVIPLLDLTLEEKLKICKDSFSTMEEDLISCNKYSIFLSSTSENKYCDKLENNDKRLCEDILSLVK